MQRPPEHFSVIEDHVAWHEHRGRKGATALVREIVATSPSEIVGDYYRESQDPGHMLELLTF